MTPFGSIVDVNYILTNVEFHYMLNLKSWNTGITIYIYESIIACFFRNYREIQQLIGNRRHFMELQEAIIARYSCRSFTERAIDSALLKTCVETAGLAPSACNSQPWKFHIIQDPAMVALTQPFTKHAAFIVVEEQKPVVSERIVNRMKNQEFHQVDIGIACAYLCLQAAELGLDTCMIGYFHEKKIKELLQIPDKKRIRLVIAVGYGSQQRRKTDRKTLQDSLTIHESL